MKIKNVNYRGHRWNELFKEDNQSMRDAGYDLILRRGPAYSELKRYGQCVSGVDAKSKDLIERYPRIAEAVASVILHDEFAPKV